jgi:hypothetical protein
MIRGIHALLTASGLALVSGLSGCLIVGDADDDPKGNGHVGSSTANLNADGCIPTGVVDRHALCICGDLDQVGTFDVRQGPTASTASIGVNGMTSLVDVATFAGSFHAYGGFSAVASAAFAGDLASAGHVSWVGELDIGGDLIAGAGLDGVGDLSVAGAVRVDGDVTVVGDQSVGSFGAYPNDLAPPCACPGTSWFDVSQAVRDARDDNHNGAIEAVGDTALHLPSGRYYFDSLASVGNLRIVAEGSVAVFVAGDLATVGDAAFEIADGASLDLYVAGSVQTVGNVAFGSAPHAGAFRLLIGGADPVLVNVGSAVFYGEIYAPTASIDFVGDTVIHGALLGRDLSGVGSLLVESAAAISTPEVTCRVPQQPEGEGQGGASTDTGGANAGGAGSGGGAPDQGGEGGDAGTAGSAAGGSCP